MLLLAELKSLLSLHYVRAYNSVVPSQTSLLLLLNRLSCPTLCDPIDGSPPGSPVLGILQARTLEWVHIKTSESLFPKYISYKNEDIHILETPKISMVKQPYL